MAGEKAELIEFLASQITENRWKTIQKVVSERTRYITVVLEDIYQPQNASAVLRTCDCSGIQDVYIIENANEYTINPDVALGSNKWLNLHRFKKEKNNSPKAIRKLRDLNYRIIATSPHRQDQTPDDLDLEKGKIALFFGTELTGLSSEVLENADAFLKIPMYGFSESFNISVSAAIILNTLVNRLRNSTLDWRLTDAEREELTLEWLKKSQKNSDALVTRFLKDRKYG